MAAGAERASLQGQDPAGDTVRVKKEGEEVTDVAEDSRWRSRRMAVSANDTGKGGNGIRFGGERTKTFSLSHLDHHPAVPMKMSDGQ